MSLSPKNFASAYALAGSRLTSTQLADAFARAFDWKTRTYGPLWRDPANVMACLRRYLASEGRHADGWPVRRLAESFLADPYAPTGEELDAVHCLLMLGCADTIISP